MSLSVVLFDPRPEHNAFIISYYSNRELTANLAIFFAIIQPQFFHFLAVKKFTALIVYIYSV